MSTTRSLTAALLIAAVSAPAALADSYGLGLLNVTGLAYGGNYTPRPGCCANAPRPTRDLRTRVYTYPDGNKVIVYPYGHGTGYQPFWWEQR